MCLAIAAVSLQKESGVGHLHDSPVINVEPDKTQMLHLGKICLLQSAILHGKTGEADVLQAIHTDKMFT